MLPYDRLFSDKAGSSSSPAPSSNRNPRACENCRTRRIRCCGGQPCSACIDVGLTERCETRAKARPKRLPRIATEASSSGAMAGWRFDHFLASVQRDIERWAEHRGPIISAALSDVFPLRHLLSATRLAHRDSPTPTVVHFYLQECLDLLPYVDYVDRTTLVELFSRYQGDPWALAPPQKALVFAASCLGSFKQSINVENDHAEWYRRSILELDGWSEASTESLIALHFLHMYTVQAGGILETRDVLKRMSIQVRGLSIHHWPSDERDAKLLFATIYKDSWYATICDSAPFLDLAEDGLRVASFPEKTQNVDQDPVPVPVLIQLTGFENELMRKLHRSPNPHSLSLDDVTQRERKWAVWMKNFKEEERRTARPMLYIYASIRFHWLRLILYHALLDSPTHAASSSAVLARSVSHILRAYTQATTDDRFLSSWPDLRRITTCGQLVFLLLDAGELLNDEAHELLTMVLELLRGLVTKCPMTEDVEKIITDLMQLTDLAAPRSAPPVALRVSNSASLPNVFDYSVLPAPDQWLCDFSVDSLMSDIYDFAA